MSILTITRKQIHEYIRRYQHARILVHDPVTWLHNEPLFYERFHAYINHGVTGSGSKMKIHGRRDF